MYNSRDFAQITNFLDWYSKFKNFTYKILIAGNHELFIERMQEDTYKILEKYPDIIYL